MVFSKCAYLSVTCPSNDGRGVHRKIQEIIMVKNWLDPNIRQFKPDEYCWYEPNKRLYLRMWMGSGDKHDLNKLTFNDEFKDYTDEEPWVLVALTENELIQANIETKFNVKIRDLVKLDPDTLREV